MSEIRKDAAPAARNGKPKIYFLSELMEQKRKEMRMTQAELARRSHLTQAQISQLEISDGTNVPRGDNLFFLARALNLTMEQLLSEQPPE